MTQDILYLNVSMQSSETEKECFLYKLEQEIKNTNDVQWEVFIDDKDFLVTWENDYDLFSLQWDDVNLKNIQLEEIIEYFRNILFLK